jgi:PPK2 family polyphosphate:nucleotide phosphotransferase
VRYTAFKAPTPEERRHPFLWRIRNALPSPGKVGVFDRSHYEDVLIVRVHDLVPRTTWSRRYSQINAFEAQAVKDGTTIVKVMLHISNEEQKARLAERLERPDKHWKFNPGDVDERAKWPDYMEAYGVALEKCSTIEAPWFVVPADRKWYARFAVTNLVLEALERMAPQWPAVDFDVEEQQARLART